MVNFLLHRVRRYLNAEILEEMAVLHEEVAALRRDTISREDVRPMIRQMEAALLAIALGPNTADEGTGQHEVGAKSRSGEVRSF